MARSGAPSDLYLRALSSPDLLSRVIYPGRACSRGLDQLLWVRERDLQAIELILPSL